MSDYATAATPTPLTTTRAERLRRFLKDAPVLQLAALAAVIIWAIVRIPAIASPMAAASILVLAALLGIAAMGQTLVVLLGGLDLAVPGYIAVGAFAATALAGGQGWPLGLAVLAAIAVTGGIGAITGYVCQRFTIQPLVFTLGTSAILTGGTIFLTGGRFIDAPPAALSDLTRVTSTTFGIPIPPIVSIWIVATVAIGLFLARTTTGRRLYATGANPRAAALARIDTRRMWTGVFAVNGALGALAGVLIAGFSAGTSAGIGEPYLFTGLAAVLVGGTTFGSIRGSYTRTAIGALLLVVLSTILIGEGISEGESRAFYGVIILVVLAIYGRERRLRDRF